MRSMWQWLSKTFRFSTTGSGTSETDADAEGSAGFEVNGSLKAASELKKSDLDLKTRHSKVKKYEMQQK